MKNYLKDLKDGFTDFFNSDYYGRAARIARDTSNARIWSQRKSGLRTYLRYLLREGLAIDLENIKGFSDRKENNFRIEEDPEFKRLFSNVN